MGLNTCTPRPDLAPTSPRAGGRPQKSTSPPAPLPYGGEVELEPKNDHRHNHSQVAPGATSNQGAANDQTQTQKTTLVHPRLAPLAHPRFPTSIHPRITQQGPDQTQPLPPLRSTTQGQLRHQERRSLQRHTQAQEHHPDCLTLPLPLVAAHPLEVRRG